MVTENSMAIFATLGPAGSNHELAASTYLRFHGLEVTSLVLVDDFDNALKMMVAGDIDHIIQAAAHSATSSLLAKAYFQHGIHAIDTFIAPTHALAILTRSDVETPVTLALQPATRDYADLSAWPTLIDEPTTVAVGQGLLAGHYDSGITMLALADKHPGRFRVELELGTVDDPWIVYGRHRACESALLAWRDSPAGRLYRGG
jgi:hypothetical protein